jgi:hypothetical protein
MRNDVIPSNQLLMSLNKQVPKHLLALSEASDLCSESHF